MNSVTTTTTTEQGREIAPSQEIALNNIQLHLRDLRSKMSCNLESLQDTTQSQIIDCEHGTCKSLSADSFTTDAVLSFKKPISNKPECSEYESIPGSNASFKPSVTKPIKINSKIGFNYGANVYSQKHNMIIACPSNSSVHFYDATKLGPIRERRVKTIDSSVVQMSYNDETDTYLMGCATGEIYTYNASDDVLTKVMREGQSFILGITYISPNTFAFSSCRSGKLYFGSLEDNKAVAHYSKDSDAWYLHHIKEQNLLLSGLSNGKIVIYSTQNTKYKMIASLQAHKFGKYVTAICNIKINGKEYIVTGGNDRVLKIWHFARGNLKLLKSIPTPADVSTIVCLENYKMIATTHHKDYVNFYSMPFGKLESHLTVGLSKARNIFRMPDKNLLGVADLIANEIRIVQLHSSTETKSFQDANQS